MAGLALAEGSRVGIGIQTEGLTKSFGSQNLGRRHDGHPEVRSACCWAPRYRQVGVPEVPDRTAAPERGSILVDGTNIIECSAKELYEIRTLFGVMFQDGALFGSMSLYDNTAFPLREHKKKKERSVTSSWKLDLVGLGVTRTSSPVRSPAVCASAPAWPSRWCSTRRSSSATSRSGLDPVRTAYLSQLLIDINAQIDCTILIVTHTSTSPGPCRTTSACCSASTW